MASLWAPAITYRIAVGPHQGRKVMTLQTLPPDAPFEPGPVAGFSLHAGVAARVDQRSKLERLCRYIARPPVAEPRLALTGNGKIRYQLKTPYRDGTTHVIFEPLDFIARLAALVPRPRTHLTRYHGVFAPNHRLRDRITPAPPRVSPPNEPPTPATDPAPRPGMRWAQRLQRVFDIDVETCTACGGRLRVIACIDDPVVIHKILGHRQQRDAATSMPRAPPQADWVG